MPRTIKASEKTAAKSKTTNPIQRDYHSLYTDSRIKKKKTNRFKVLSIIHRHR